MADPGIDPDPRGEIIYLIWPVPKRGTAVLREEVKCQRYVMVISILCRILHNLRYSQSVSVICSEQVDNNMERW